MTSTRTRTTSTDSHGPQVAGGRYRNGYWGEEYDVLAVHLGREGNPIPWSNWSVTVRWENGRITTHCTAWDARRDRVLAQPTLAENLYPPFDGDDEAETGPCEAHTEPWAGHAHNPYTGCLVVTEDRYPADQIRAAHAWLLALPWLDEWERHTGELLNLTAFSVVGLIEHRHPNGWAGFLTTLAA